VVIQTSIFQFSGQFIFENVDVSDSSFQLLNYYTKDKKSLNMVFKNTKYIIGNTILVTIGSSIFIFLDRNFHWRGIFIH